MVTLTLLCILVPPPLDISHAEILCGDFRGLGSRANSHDIGTCHRITSPITWAGKDLAACAT
jgi:hypothetical protein